MTRLDHQQKLLELYTVLFTDKDLTTEKLREVVLKLIVLCQYATEVTEDK